MELPFLDPIRPIFPLSSTALAEPNGLLALGGNLDVETLLQAYRQGAFPWFEAGQPILWWSPDPRAVIYPGDVHISRSMAKALRRDNYEIRIDTEFESVVRSCASPRNPTEISVSDLDEGIDHYREIENEIDSDSDSEGQAHTWISPDMVSAYCRLFNQGHAHSVECWVEDELAGGLYGLVIGGVFCGESMFSRRPNASKLALIHLAKVLDEANFSLIDCQITNPHLTTLGAVEITRHEFLDILFREQRTRVLWPGASAFAKVAQSFLNK